MSYTITIPNEEMALLLMDAVANHVTLLGMVPLEDALEKDYITSGHTEADAHELYQQIGAQLLDQQWA